MSESFEISPGRVDDIVGRACWVSTEARVVVRGSVMIKCAKFSVAPVTPAEGIVFASPPADSIRSLYRIDTYHGASVALLCSAPAELWPIGGHIESGARLVGQDGFVNVGSSRAMLAYPEQLSCGVGIAAANSPWIQTRPATGQPGCLIGRATKLATAAAAALTNASVAVAGVPVYVAVSIVLPLAGGTSYPTNSYWVYFRANDLPAAVAGSPAFGVKLGDLGALRGTTPITFAINHNVTEVGVWLPTAEEPAIGPVNTFAAIDVGVWTLLAARNTPTSGYSGMPPGFVPAAMPAQFFMEQEARLGSTH